MYKELLDTYSETKDIDIRNKIVEMNIPLIRHIVSKIHRPSGLDQEFEDLVHYGVFGLIDAIERFDGRDVKFSTYAYSRIYGTIIDELRHLDWVPRTVRSKIKKFRKYLEDMTAVLGPDIDVMQLAKDQGLSAYEIDIMNGTHVVDYSKISQYLEDNGGVYATVLW